MPIQKFLSTSVNVGAGLARIGKLHKGLPKQKKVKEGREYEVVGRDTDYFRMEFAEGYDHLSADFVQLYGEQPKHLPIMLNADTALEALDFWYEDYNSSGTLLHRCDGVNQPVCYNTTTGFYDQNKPCVIGSCSCKQVARLALVLPEFIAQTGVLGTVTMETHSDQDIRTLIARLTTYANMFGTLRGVPLILFRAKKDTSAPKTDNKGKRTGERVKVPRAMIDIQVDPEFTRTRLMGALTGQYTSRALPHTSNPDASQAVVQEGEARLALGSGQRRIDAPAPQLEQPSVSVWTADAKRWKGFVDWAGVYGMSEHDVFRALEEACEMEINQATDWTGDEISAMAAVIACVCDYKAEKIAKYTIKVKSQDTQTAVRTRALKIAETRSRSVPEEIVPNVEPDADAIAFASKDSEDIPY